jgi:hypothetical protein
MISTAHAHSVVTGQWAPRYGEVTQPGHELQPAIPTELLRLCNAYGLRSAAPQLFCTWNRGRKGSGRKWRWCYVRRDGGPVGTAEQLWGPEVRGRLLHSFVIGNILYSHPITQNTDWTGYQRQGTHATRWTHVESRDRSPVLDSGNSRYNICIARKVQQHKSRTRNTLVHT